MKKIIKIIVPVVILAALVLVGFYLYPKKKITEDTDNKFLVNNNSAELTNNEVAGAETNSNQSISTQSTQSSGSTNSKSISKSSSSQQSSQTTTPQPPQTVTPPTPPPPSCNQSQKAALITLYDGYIAKTGEERDRIKNDALSRYLAEVEAIKQEYNDIWDPAERMRLIVAATERAGKTLTDSRNTADSHYNGEVSALTISLNAALRDIHC